MEALINRYQKYGLSLCLGAGISVQSGIPSWETLLKRLCIDITDDPNLFELLINNGADYLSLANYLVSKDTDWVTKLRNAIYQDFKYYKTNIAEGNKAQFVNYVEDSNASLSAIGDLLALKNEGQRTFRANPNINSIFTLNFDCVLQSYCYAKFQKRILRTTERASASRMEGRINIYHLHGMLRFDNRISLEKESSDKIILTENEYFARFANPYNVFNYTLLTHLRENSFLFIGLSMTDINLRRLLYLSKNEIINAYRNEGISAAKLKQKVQQNVNKHFAILKSSGDKTVKKYYEESLKNLGVNILWIDDFNEITTILDTLKLATNKE
ncbi:MAG: SIR2 family protein [Bacteroidota bacterium]